MVDKKEQLYISCSFKILVLNFYNKYTIREPRVCF